MQEDGEELRPSDLEQLAPGPDLSLVAFSATLKTIAGAPYLEITGTLSNDGSEDAGASEVSFFLTESDAQATDARVLQRLAVDALAAGELFDFSLNIPLNDDITKTSYVSAVVDSGNAVDEANEANNTLGPVTLTHNVSKIPPASLNIETFAILLLDSSDVQTTADLAAFGAGLRLAEALNDADLVSLNADLARAGINGFDTSRVFQSQILPRLMDGTVDSVVLYRDSNVLKALPEGVSAYEIPALPGQLTPFDAEVIMRVGTADADSFQGTSEGELFVGDKGRDTVEVEGLQATHSLVLTPTSVTLIDRSDPLGCTDTLTSIEVLDFQVEIEVFDNQPMPLEMFIGTAQLSADEFALITELYIAYFNRAPDAIGLYFWGSLFERGFTLEQMAASFFDQPETRATYAAVLDERGELRDVDVFVTEVYFNVLGRAPDAEGFAFWTFQLETNPNITPPTFILSIINGAKFAADPVPQTFVDQQYLATKADIGAYFAIIKGMSDVDDARSVMALYDGSEASVEAAIGETDAHHFAASDAETGDFLFPLVGVIDAPFLDF